VALRVATRFSPLEAELHDLLPNLDALKETVESNLALKEWARKHADPLAEVDAKLKWKRADQPGDGWPFPISHVINLVVWFFTEASWFGRMVVVAILLLAGGIGIGVRRRGAEPRAEAPE
jgi:hypothetical protein